MKEKINIGIYLGNEYSSIARIVDGEPFILKSGSLKDTIPTCVHINKKGAIQVGDSAYNALKRDKLKAGKGFDADTSNSFVEFLRTIGTDKVYCSTSIDKNFSSEELIAEIIKVLKSFITDEEVKAAVITVPAKSTLNQKDAIVKAGKLAGLKQVELLQEPIATTMAYGLDSKSKDGYWLVFDFEGGTFDASLLKVEEGIMKVVDTEGDNYLGGKNLDYAIVDEIFIPFLQENYKIDSFFNDDNKKANLIESLKFYAEETREQLNFNESHNVFSDFGDIPGEDDEDNEFELDILVTQEMVQSTLGSIFQKAINICLELLKRNNLSGSDLDSLILVGETTYSPILRKMIESQICKPDMSIDPITATVKGAALYASTIDVSEEIKEQQRDKTKIQLEIGYEATTVEEEEFVTVKILNDKTEGEIPSKVYVDIIRSDKAWSSGKTEIDEAGDVMEVKLNTGKPNAFDVLTYNEQGDLLQSEPSSFSITHSSKLGSGTLPYHIGIEIKDQNTDKIVFRTITGLEKNQSIPAIGTINGLKTQKLIRPGIAEDLIKIPIYQGDYGAEGTRAIYNEHVFDIIISGKDLPSVVEEGSEFDIAIKVDKSERLTISVYFPCIDYFIKIDHNSVYIDVEQKIDDLKTLLIDSLQDNKSISQDIFSKYYDALFDLGTIYSNNEIDFDKAIHEYEILKQEISKIIR